MTGKDFLSLAVRLSASAAEAELRSAVSRAYYGVFHTAHALLAGFGVDLPTSADAHEKLRYCLDAGGTEDSQLASTKLDILRRDRNKADYSLRDAALFTRANVAARLQLAIEADALISRCATEPQQAVLRDNVRAYAKDNLRLNVR